MSSSTVSNQIALATEVDVTDDTLSVSLTDGRTIVVPLEWFPRLVHASAKERGEWRFIGKGTGIHWPRIDEDISVEGLLRGRPSGETQSSLKKWLAGRAKPNRGRTG